MKNDRYDFDNFEKGLVITAETIEQITGVNRFHRKYALECLKLRHHIEMTIYEQSEEHVTTMVKGFDVYICTDREALEVNIKRFQGALNAIARAYEKTRAIDVKNLTSFDRKRHERTLLNQSRIKQAIENANTPKSHKKAV